MSSDGISVSPNQNPTLADQQALRRLAVEMDLSGANRRAGALIAKGNLGSFVITERNNTTAYTWRSRLVCHQDCSDLVLWFTNSFVTASSIVGLGNAFDLKVGIELADDTGAPTGVVIPVTFSGNRVVTVAELAVVSSDPVPIPMRAGEVFFVRCYPHNGSTYLPFNLMMKSGLATVYEGLSGVGDNVDSGAITATYPQRGFGPFAVSGTTSRRNGLMIVGTSIEHWQNDYGLPSDTYTSGAGWIQRALGVDSPYCNLASSGESAGVFMARENALTRWPMAPYCSDALLTFLTNDAAADVPTMKSRFSTVVAQLKAAGMRRIISATILPRTNSTDGWTTTANQTANISAAKRNEINAWLRGGADDQIDLCLDIAAAVGVGTNYENWSPNVLALTTAVAAAPASNTTIVYVNAAMTNYAYNGYVAKVASAYRSVRLSGTNYIQPAPNLAGSPSIADPVLLYSGYTHDGVHPSGLGHQAIAAAVGDQLRTFLRR